MSVDIRIKNAVKRYGENTVIKDLSVEIKEGEFFTLLGPSGCGKTTLLRMIAGFNSIEGGDFFFGERRVNDMDPAKRNIGMVFQNYAIFPHMTVEGNVAFGLKNRKVPKEKISRRVDEILKKVHIDNLRDRLPQNMSGGQQQRVALARAIVIEPDVLLMDEPLSNLDAKLRKEMRLEIRNIQKKLNVTTIFVTHDQEEALTMADTIAIMNGGVVEQLGSPLEMYEHPNTQFVASFIGGTNLIEGEVVTSEGNAVTVRCGKTMLRGLTNNTLTPGQKVITSQRPERLRLHANGETGGNCVRGKITTRVYLGASIRFVVEDEEGRNIIVDLPINEDLEIYKTGAPCFVIWDSDDCHVLDS